METKILFCKAVDHIKKVLDNVRKADKYTRKVKELELINKTDYTHVCNVMVNLLVDTEIDETIKNNENEKLAILATTFTEELYFENLYPLEVLEDIKFYQSNLLRFITFFYTPEENMKFYMDCSEKLKDSSILKEIEGAATFSRKEQYVTIKENMVVELLHILMTCNAASSFKD